MQEWLFQHGWGLNGAFWQGWRSLFPTHTHVADHGYFSTPLQPHFKDSKSQKIVVAHSFGLHLLSKKILQQADFLVLFGCFEQFVHPSSEEDLLRSLLLMQRQFKKNPYTVLRRFLRDSLFPHSSESARCLVCRYVGGIENGQCAKKCQDFDRKKLERGLQLLQDSRFDLKVLEIIPKVLLLHGQEDRIVNEKKAIDLHGKLKQSELIVFEGAGHFLPLTHQAMCYQKIKERVSS